MVVVAFETGDVGMLMCLLVVVVADLGMLCQQESTCDLQSWLNLVTKQAHDVVKSPQFLQADNHHRLVDVIVAAVAVVVAVAAVVRGMIMETVEIETSLRRPQNLEIELWTMKTGLTVDESTVQTRPLQRDLLRLVA